MKQRLVELALLLTIVLGMGSIWMYRAAHPTPAPTPSDTSVAYWIVDNLR